MKRLSFGGLSFLLEKGERAAIRYRGEVSPLAECVLSGQDKLSRDKTVNRMLIQSA